MKRTLILLALAACSKASDAPKPFTHTAPAFVVDVPAGFAAPSDLDGPHGTIVRILGPHAPEAIVLTWRPIEGTAAAERNAFIGFAEGTGRKVKGQGELPGDGAWYEDEGMLTALVPSEGQMITCVAQGSARASAACKTLRPK